MGGMEMEQPIKTFRLRVRSGEYARKWLAAAGCLAKKKGVPADPLPFEDAERHPENYFTSRGFTDDKDGAWQVTTFEMAKAQQIILEREGIDTEIV